MEVRSTKTGLTDTQAVELYFQTYAGVGRRPGLSREQLDYLLSSRQINFYAGYFEGEARSMLISARHGTTTYYMAAVKVPVGNKPLSHRLLHEAVLDAQAEGQKRFDFGVLHTDDSWNPKLRSIALYKRGYTRSFERRRLYWVAV